MGDQARNQQTEGSEQVIHNAHHCFLVMEDLLDKLKLLDYENSFCKNMGYKYISRHYFAMQINSGEQFHKFTGLVAWLLGICGVTDFEPPQEYDDPNATISNILGALKKLSIQTDFPPSKLKTGAGQQVCYVLDSLADVALKSIKFKWDKPIYPEEENEDDENFFDENLEVTTSKEVEDEEIEEEGEFEEEDNYLDLESMKTLQHKSEDEKDVSKPEGVMESNTDVTEWRMEVERVLPSLKDWRSHLEQMHQYRDGIESTLTETRGHLDKLHQEITKTLEKISSREKYVNNQLDNSLQEFRGRRDGLAEINEKYKQGSVGVNNLTKTLSQITEELEVIKSQMDERGTSMTDSGPLVKIKQALTRLKNDITQMDLRIGVVEHILMNARLKDKSNLRQDLDLATTGPQESYTNFHLY
ncbi:Intraflagellar transport protein 57-like protein [Trichoplax sp. H2]|nr:Intraflagellar transport protein 57-like protein [Trichoplax sp. H2]|eukprot:RDD41609.1 Intraflagellar transport protein 57-like protein [Trichoplax sp. H2]